MLKFRYKIKGFLNKSDISFYLKSVESLNCFLRCQSVLSKGCLLFYHGTKHLKVLYIILLLDLLDLTSFFRWKKGGQVPPLDAPGSTPAFDHDNDHVTELKIIQLMLEFQPMFFQPRQLKNLFRVDQVESMGHESCKSL